MKGLIVLTSVLLSAALILAKPDTPAAQINNSNDRSKNQAVQAEVPRKVSTLNEQEKALTEQQVVSKPEPAIVAPPSIKAEEPTSPQPPKVLTDHEKYMQAAGIKESDWSAVEYIIQHESSWRPTIYNNEGCVGLGQRCPASLLLKDCPDLDPVCQLRHFTKYAESRYGSWQSAYNAWVGKHWW